MAIPPQKFREIVFQILYSCDLSGVVGDELIPLLMKELAASRGTILKARDRAQEVLAKRAEIDALIGRISRGYDFSRIQSVERNALRLGAYELLFEQEVPPKVAISEAMRICRKFSTPEAASFVNAILDAIYKSSQGDNPDEQLLKAAEGALSDSEERAQRAAKEVDILAEDEPIE